VSTFSPTAGIVPEAVLSWGINCVQGHFVLDSINPTLHAQKTVDIAMDFFIFTSRLCESALCYDSAVRLSVCHMHSRDL